MGMAAAVTLATPELAERLAQLPLVQTGPSSMSLQALRSHCGPASCNPAQGNGLAGLHGRSGPAANPKPCENGLARLLRSTAICRDSSTRFVQHFLPSARQTFLADWP